MCARSDISMKPWHTDSYQLDSYKTGTGVGERSSRSLLGWLKDILVPANADLWGRIMSWLHETQQTIPKL